MNHQGIHPTYLLEAVLQLCHDCFVPWQHVECAATPLCFLNFHSSFSDYLLFALLFKFSHVSREQPMAPLTLLPLSLSTQSVSHQHRCDVMKKRISFFYTLLLPFCQGLSEQPHQQIIVPQVMVHMLMSLKALQLICYPILPYDIVFRLTCMEVSCHQPKKQVLPDD
jgi:hypothetical protein